MAQLPLHHRWRRWGLLVLLDFGLYGAFYLRQRHRLFSGRHERGRFNAGLIGRGAYLLRPRNRRRFLRQRGGATCVSAAGGIAQVCFRR